MYRTCSAANKSVRGALESVGGEVNTVQNCNIATKTKLICDVMVSYPQRARNLKMRGCGVSGGQFFCLFYDIAFAFLKRCPCDPCLVRHSKLRYFLTYLMLCKQRRRPWTQSDKTEQDWGTLTYSIHRCFELIFEFLHYYSDVE